MEQAMNVQEDFYSDIEYKNRMEKNEMEKYEL